MKKNNKIFAEKFSDQVKNRENGKDEKQLMSDPGEGTYSDDFDRRQSRMTDQAVTKANAHMSDNNEGLTDEPNRTFNAGSEEEVYQPAPNPVVVAPSPTYQRQKEHSPPDATVSKSPPKKKKVAEKKPMSRMVLIMLAVFLFMFLLLAVIFIVLYAVEVAANKKTTPAPTPAPILCRYLQWPLHGKILYSPNDCKNCKNTNATYSCFPGYYVTYYDNITDMWVPLDKGSVFKRTCMKKIDPKLVTNGQWGSKPMLTKDPKCGTVNCDYDASIPVNGTRIYFEGTKVGDKAILKCKPGFRWPPCLGESPEKCGHQVVITCKPDGPPVTAVGVWKRGKPLKKFDLPCKIISCDNLKANFTNGVVEYSPNPKTLTPHFWSTANFSCKHGYFLDGPSWLRCEDGTSSSPGGIWSGKIPKCKEVKCLKLSAPLNGSVKYEDHNHKTIDIMGNWSAVGNTAKFKCEKYFRLFGKNIMTCSVGNWSDSDLHTNMTTWKHGNWTHGNWTSPALLAAPTCETCPPSKGGNRALRGLKNPYTYRGEQESNYFLSKEMKTWEEARKMCTHYCGDLVSFDDKGEFQTVVGQVEWMTKVWNLPMTKSAKVWVGAKYETTKGSVGGSFEWVSGGDHELIQAVSGGGVSKRDCVVMDSSPLADPRNPYDGDICGYKHLFVCEMPGTMKTKGDRKGPKDGEKDGEFIVIQHNKRQVLHPLIHPDTYNPHFNENWETFLKAFGSDDSKLDHGLFYWRGLKAMHHMAQGSNWELLVAINWKDVDTNLHAFNGKALTGWGWRLYKEFTIGDKDSNYTFNVDVNDYNTCGVEPFNKISDCKWPAGATDSLATKTEYTTILRTAHDVINGRPFGTTVYVAPEPFCPITDHPKNPCKCAATQMAGWWWDGCGDVQLNNPDMLWNEFRGNRGFSKDSHHADEVIMSIRQSFPKDEKFPTDK